jgi:hypothetical protein
MAGRGAIKPFKTLAENALPWPLTSLITAGGRVVEWLKAPHSKFFALPLAQFFWCVPVHLRGEKHYFLLDL